MHELAQVFGGTNTNGSPNTQFLYSVTVADGVNMTNAITAQTNKNKSQCFQYDLLKQGGEGRGKGTDGQCLSQPKTNKQSNGCVNVNHRNTYGTGSKPLLWSHKSNSSFSDVVGMRLHPELFCKWQKMNFFSMIHCLNFINDLSQKSCSIYAFAIFQMTINLHGAIQLFCFLIKYC